MNRAPQRKSAARAALAAAVLVISVETACDQPLESENTSLAAAAEGTETISSRHFGRQNVPCRNSQELARALLELTSRDLGDDTTTRLLDHGTDEVRLKDGKGQIVVIVYAITGADRQAEITTTEHFLVNDSCQVLHWSSAVNPAG